MVNIAVFAAFACCIQGILLSNADYKPIWPIHQLDVSCYGWQKRHDRGKKRQGCGKVGGQNGTVLSRCRGIQVYAAAGTNR